MGNIKILDRDKAFGWANKGYYRKGRWYVHIASMYGQSNKLPIYVLFNNFNNNSIF